MSARPTAAAPPPGSARGGTFLGLTLVLLAALSLHADALRAPFFADDYLFLDQVRNRSLIEALTAPDPLGNYVRPVSRQLHFWWLAGASGESAASFHAVNLGLWLALVALLFAIARRWLGPRVAIVSAAVLALHYSADVPVMWASGSQDLLAVVGALAAILLYRHGRTLWAAVVMLLALFCKETVLLAPLIAVAVDRRVAEPWSATLRRALPMGAAAALWGLSWWLTAGRRPAMGLEARFDPAGLPAAFAHLPQVVLGFEWPHDGWSGWLHGPPVVALVLAALAVTSVWARPPGGVRGAQAPPSRVAPSALPGLLWAALGTVPVFAVADIWSAYYYLFAICGAALALGALTVSRPLWVPLAMLVLIGWGSANARAVHEFATARGAWTTQSHLNRFYLERGMRVAERYLADLRRLRPELPPRSTLFFAGLPASVAFQSADGPLLRWAYRDSSIRSYFLTRFKLEQARRGPVFFFKVQNDTLREIAGAGSFQQIAYGMMLSDTPEPARDILTLALEHDPHSAMTRYWMAWAQWALGDAAAARGSLARAGIADAAGPAPETPAALAAVAAGDTVRAIGLMRRAVRAHGLDAGAHALLADLLLARRDPSAEGPIEAYAARVLAPDHPMMWRRWGMVQVLESRAEQAVASLERYRALAGSEAQGDLEVTNLIARLRRELPGGDLAQAELRK